MNRGFLPLLFSFLLASQTGFAGEYRYRDLIGVTGLGDRIYDARGRETTVKLQFADAEARLLFLELQKLRICGTEKARADHGVRWDQKIILVGDFASPPKRMPYDPHGAPSELYRDFRVTGLKVAFPLSRFRPIETNEADPPVYLETHFGFDTLLPHGLKLHGKPIDLARHEMPSKT